MIDFKEAFRIDFKKSIPMKKRLQQKKIELATLKLLAEQNAFKAEAESELAKDNNNNNNNNGGGGSGGGGGGGDIEMKMSSTGGSTSSSSSTISATHVQNTSTAVGDVETPSMHTNLPVVRPSTQTQTQTQTQIQIQIARDSINNNISLYDAKEYIKNDEEIKIAFILKLCTTQMSCGQCTVDTEIHATNASLALGLYPPTLDIGPRVMHAAFQSMTTYHYLATSRDIVLCKLQDVTSVAKIITLEGNKFMRNDIEALSAILDDIMNEPLPYGWFIQDILFVSLGVLATIAAFFGSYSNMIIVFIISLFILLLQKLTRAYPAVLSSIELVLVCMISSFFTAASYNISKRYNLGFDTQYCNIPIIYLSPLLVYLPGSELIYGAYELQMGHMVVGASRLVHALVKCMVMACGLLIGWQFTGYNFFANVEIDNNNTTILIDSGSQASFVPANKCIPFEESWNIGPWWMVFAVWNLALLVPVLGGLQVRVRDMPNHYIIAYITLLLFGALNFQEDCNGLTTFLVNIIGLFVATNLSCLKEFMTGVPAVSSIVPVLLVLAPGSVVVLQVLTLMQIDGNVPIIAEHGTTQGSANIASYLWLLGVTYSLGMYLALAIWKPILLKREMSSDIISIVRDYRKRESVGLAFG